MHGAVLAAFAATGTPLSAAEIERVIRAGGGDPQLVRAELTAADLIAFTDHGEIRAAYPFSPAATAIRVSRDDGPDVYAMCAIDALGMSAMLGQPVTIAASEPDTGLAISVVVDIARARWAPRTAVVFAALLVPQAARRSTAAAAISTSSPLLARRGTGPAVIPRSLARF